MQCYVTFGQEGVAVPVTGGPAMNTHLLRIVALDVDFKKSEMLTSLRTTTDET